MPTCAICKRKDNNPEDYGEFMKKSGIRVHYFCLLLSTNLPQLGEDHSGILGFLLRDIRKEIKSCYERTCRYCNKSNANIACHVCKKYFHQICGNENECVSEFINEFHSYCHEHVPFKNDPMLPGMPPDCWICHLPLGKFSPTRILRAYCCKNGYVHRKCMRQYALSAGYYLRCLWCRKKEFRDDVRRHGVFVPDREAQWDNNETFRYADLHRGYSRCDAKLCLCPQGREYIRNKWKLKICTGCGGSGIHDKCGEAKLIRGQYTCDFCSEILNKTNAAEEARKNNNCGFNYTLFMSKTFEEFEPLPEKPIPPPLAVKAASNALKTDNEQEFKTAEATKAVELQANETQPSELQTNKPQPSELQINKPQPSELQTNKPQPNEAQPTKPEPGEPQQSTPQASKPRSSKPKSSKAQSSKPQSSKPQSSKPQPKKSQSGNRKSKPKLLEATRIKEMYLFNNNFEIIGAAKVKDEVKAKEARYPCPVNEVVGFLNADRIFQNIFAEITAQGRVLSTDMVDEVMQKMKEHLELFGDVPDFC